MAGTKFSGFTTGATTANTKIVGYDSALSTNNQYTLGQLATGMGITTLYDGDGTLSGARDVDMDGNNLTFTYGTGAVWPDINMGKVIIYPNGENSINPPTTIKTSGNIYFTYGAPYYQGLHWTSFNVSQKAWYTQMYGGGGWSHYQGYSVIGPNFATITSGGALTAKLGIIGLHNDNTSYAFRVQNSDLTDIFHVNNDTLTTVEKNLLVKGQTYNDGVHDIGTIAGGGTATPNWDNGNIQKLTIDSSGGAAAITLANAASTMTAGATYILIIIQGGTAAGTISSYGTHYKFPGATAPTLTTGTANQADVITMVAYSSTVLMCTSTLNFVTS